MRFEITLTVSGLDTTRAQEIAEEILDYALGHYQGHGPVVSCGPSDDQKEPA